MQIKTTSDEVTIIKRIQQDYNPWTMGLCMIVSIILIVITLSNLYSFIFESYSNTFFFIISLVVFAISLQSFLGGLSIFFNKTYMFVYSELITVYNKPIPHPYLTNKKIPIDQIERLFYKKFVDIYQLKAQEKSGASNTLFTYLSRKEALSIAETLKNHFNLEIEEENN